MQIVARLIEAFFWRGFHPLFTALVATGSAALCSAMLLLPIPPVLAAVLFVFFFGVLQGLTSIVMGTLTLSLFGAEGYGELMGRMGLVRVLLTAGAPFLFALSLSGIGFFASFLILFLIGASALPPLLVLARRHGLRG
jgi:hypothetical protein